MIKELERHLAALSQGQNRQGIDVTRLRALLANLARLRTELGALGGSWLQPLRDSEFLASIKHRSAIPGGTCEFDLPDYFFWLNQPAEERTEAFARWLVLLRPLCDAIAELLWLTRQNGRARDGSMAAAGVVQRVMTFVPRRSIPAAAHLPCLQTARFIRRSVAVTIAAVCDSCSGMASSSAPLRPRPTSRSGWSAAASDDPRAPALALSHLPASDRVVG